MKKNTVRVYDTMSKKYVDVEVSEEVRIYYNRTQWNIDDNNESFYNHEIQFSALIGGKDGTFENFRKFINEHQDVKKKAVHKVLVERLYDCLIFLLQSDRELIPSSKRHKLWTAHSVKYILTNERYIGDAVFQKNYVTETIPHLEKRNYGEKSKYYVSDSNPAIVEKTIFETVQKMLEDRHKPYLNSGHFLSGRIYCNNCGSTFKYKKNTCGDRWVCRKPDVSAEKCLSKPVSQEQIYDAFITLYNKLKLNYSVIFPPLLLQLQELKKRKFSGNQRYMDMSKEIAELKEQTHVLARLRTKGFLDESKYLEQTSAINAKINRLGSEQRKITQSDDEDDIIDKIKEVASIIENGIELMTTFDEILYESLIEKIVVIDQNKLKFQLYGGLKFLGIIN